MSVLPGAGSLTGQPEEGLVHEARHVEGVAMALAAHVARRDLAQIRVHERDQATERVGVSAAPGPEQVGYDAIGLGRRHSLELR